MTERCWKLFWKVRKKYIHTYNFASRTFFRDENLCIVVCPDDNAKTEKNPPTTHDQNVSLSPNGFILKLDGFKPKRSCDEQKLIGSNGILALFASNIMNKYTQRSMLLLPQIQSSLFFRYCPHISDAPCFMSSLKILTSYQTDQKISNRSIESEF